MPDTIVKFGFYKMFSYDKEEELDNLKSKLIDDLRAFEVDAVIEEEEDQDLYGLELDESTFDDEDEDPDSDDESIDANESEK